MINPYQKKNGGSETNLSNMVAKDFQAFLLSTIVPSCPIAALRHSNVVDVCALSKLPLGGIGSKCAPKTREKEKKNASTPWTLDTKTGHVQNVCHLISTISLISILGVSHL